MKAKPYYKSKTMIFNFLAALLVVAGAFGYNEFKADPLVVELAAVLIPIVNIGLRKVTSQPVK